MDYAKFVALLKKQSKTEELSEQEQNVMTEWKKNDPEAGSQLEKIWQWSGEYKTNYRADTQQGLRRLQQQMAEERQPAKKGKLISIRVLQWVAIAAILAGSVFCLPLILPSDLPAYQTAMGETREVSLPDGSIIVLNEGSSLQLERSFVKGTGRMVVLQGEAFFDIQSNPDDPFIIQTNETKVEVLGTEFFLRAYPKEDSTVLKVEEGLVRFADKNAELLVEANQQGACYHRSEILKKQEVEELTRPDWYQNRAQQFRGTPIQKFCEALEDRFEVNFTYGKNALSEECALITFSIQKNESLESLLQRLRRNLKIEKTGPGTFKVLEVYC